MQNTLFKILEVFERAGVPEAEAIMLIGTFVDELEEIKEELDDMPKGVLN